MPHLTCQCTGVSTHPLSMTGPLWEAAAGQRLWPTVPSAGVSWRSGSFPGKEPKVAGVQVATGWERSLYPRAIQASKATPEAPVFPGSEPRLV